VKNVEIKSIEVEKQLLSSSIYREDRILLAENKVEDAQKMKDKVEESQRNDRKLRQKHNEKKIRSFNIILCNIHYSLFNLKL